MKRQAMANVLVVPVAVLTLAAHGWAQPRELTAKELVALGKPATALVEVIRSGRPEATGSAFCVHEAGLFATNRHVLLSRGIRSIHEDIRGIPLVDQVTLVLRAGETDQQEVKARVVRVSEDLDLALLRVEGTDRTFPALALGTIDGLVETAEVMAFGFPFGRALALKRGSYPSISVNAGRITSLRKNEGVLTRIQLDAVLNPGNSGGAVIDRRGKVIGVVVSGLVGLGVNFAIPVSHLRQFLSRPEILFTPPVLEEANQHQMAEFRARTASVLSPAAPTSLQLILETGVGMPRRYNMTVAGGIHRVKAVPVPAREGPLLLRIEVRYADGSVSGTVADRSFTIGNTRIKLSDVRRLRFGQKAEALLNSGQALRGSLSDLPVVPITVGGQSLGLKLDKPGEIEVESPVEVDRVICTVVALQAGKEVTRLSVPVPVEGVASETVYAAMGEGRFVRPRRSAIPTTYLRAVSSKGDYIGQGKTYSYSGDELVVRGNTRAVTISVGGWMLEFSAPRGQVLKVGEYANAKRSAFSGSSPGINITGHGRGSNRVAGKFVVWELETKGNAIVRLAIDFTQRSEETRPPFYGAVRVNSHYR